MRRAIETALTLAVTCEPRLLAEVAGKGQLEHASGVL